MPATMSRPSAGIALWWLIPQPVRLLLRARAPIECDDTTGMESLIVSVGNGKPLRWLELLADDDGAIQCHLWEVGKKTKQVAAERVASDELAAMLTRWAKDYLGMTPPARNSNLPDWIPDCHFDESVLR
jgi:hypothetical protein